MFDDSATFGAEPLPLEMSSRSSSLQIQKSHGLILSDVFSSHAIVCRCRHKAFDQFQ
jgi:hypothetical protein